MDRKMHIDPARHYIPFKSAQLYHPQSVHVSLGNRAGNEKLGADCVTLLFRSF